MSPSKVFQSAEACRKPIGWLSIMISTIIVLVMLSVFTIQHQEVEEQEKNITRLEDSIRDMLFISNRSFVIYHEEGGVVSWPPTAQQLLGWTSNDVRTSGLSVMIPEKYRIDHRKALEKALKAPPEDRKTIILHQDALSKDGILVPVRITVWVVGNNSRSIVAIIESETTVVDSMNN